MIQIQHVLCPVDFSETSRRAFDHAAAVAHWYGAKLTALYVYLNLPAMGLPPPSIDDEAYARVQAELTRISAHVPPGVPLELCVEESIDVYREIVDQARSRGADLLVLGSHGRSGFERLLLGSVTEKVLRKAPCPVMVVPPHAAEAEPERPVRLRHLLCPVDFSEGAAAALRHARSLAREAGARLTVLHVIEVPRDLGENALAAWVDPDRLRADTEADRLKRLGDLIHATADTPASSPPAAGEAAAPPPAAGAASSGEALAAAVETMVRQGVVYEEILGVAAAGAADLIVMGVQGRGAIDLMVFGSNTAQVARAATCPVLVVRHG